MTVTVWFSAVVFTLILLAIHTTTAQVYVCSKVDTCGNGVKELGENCDDGNTQDNDGCSSTCSIEYCGNGKIERSEQCDDANTLDADGCSRNCKVECDWTCSQSGSDPSKCSRVRFAECGNGRKELFEECDDGNRNNNDGCSSSCKIEDGHYCFTDSRSTVECGLSICQGICGNTLLGFNETCDDGNTKSSDGCSRACQVECGYECTRKTGNSREAISSRDSCPIVIPGATTTTCTAIRCGDGKRARGIEGCDDGNTNDGDGCDSSCNIERNYECDENDCNPSTCKDRCGNGRIVGDEQCDTGGLFDPGCSNCKVVCGYICKESEIVDGVKLRSQCETRCGDGIVVLGFEDCDDGNLIDGDGCDKSCKVEEANFECENVARYPDTCLRSSCRDRCGNGIKATWEQCDVGSSGGVGCSPDCSIECGYTCTEDANGLSTCKSTCGDGIRTSDEKCDDGNTISGDGCSSTCTVEAGSRCPTPDACGRSVCNTCGNGKKDASEECDDDNDLVGDGCSSDCKIECGYTCTEDAAGLSSCETTCGDGKLVGAEQCDDGNVIDGDGCSSTCTIEGGSTCQSPTKCSRSVCITCGNGKKDGSKECDDGNNVDGDGCSSNCELECGYTCTEDATGLSTCKTTCGDGIVVLPGELCDDGNVIDGDGCSSTCQQEDPKLFTCVPSFTDRIEAGLRCLTMSCSPACGSGKISSDKECDDDNTVSGDGCSSQCKVECGYSCTENSAGLSTCTVPCGDGKIGPGEECDDGNVVNGDGCDSACKQEKGFVCNDPVCSLTRDSASVCKIECGTGLKNGNKECDDDNTIPRDGCSSDCKIECGWNCVENPTTAPSSCSAVCGDGIRALGSAEECDDGNTIDGDGCSSSCKYEGGSFVCERPFCQRTNCYDPCGSGRRNSTEQCDDNNLICGDGCDNTCTIECGYTCTEDATTKLSTCETTCGDGKKTGKEQCDDGNTISGDGCSATCTIERDTHSCETLQTCGTSVCSDICGNNKRVAPEECDDGPGGEKDGCNNCKIECGYLCLEDVDGKSTCSPRQCGDGIIAFPFEECDDGNTENNDGCSQICIREREQFDCDTVADANGCGKTICRDACGNGVRKDGEECDDGNEVSGDGCSGDCKIECGYDCNEADATSASVCSTTCGDSKLAFGKEACDDGNTRDGDGCSATCTQEDEKLFQCDPSPTSPRLASDSSCGPLVCKDKCGNGKIGGVETCDDANSARGDGCSPSCQTECGYTCKTEGLPCTATECGDGVIAGSEDCDDGNTVDGDGCSSNCIIEQTHTCTRVAGTTCGLRSECIVKCSNGERTSPEGCDDGNLQCRDGCDNNCKVECGWECTHANVDTGLSTCKTTCGDGVRASGESCDDGNTIDGDGCSANCLEEGGYWCTHEECGASTCVKNTCGDGKLWKLDDEECDPGCTNCEPGCQSCKIQSAEYRCNPDTCGNGISTSGRTGSSEVCDDGGRGQTCTRDCLQTIQSSITNNVNTAPPARTTNDSDGLSGGAIAGIIIAVIVVIVIVVVIVVIVVMKGKGKGGKTADADAAPSQPPPLQTNVKTVESATPKPDADHPTPVAPSAETADADPKPE